MSKTIGSILESAVFPITIIDRRAGQIIAGVTLEAAALVTGNPLLATVGAFELNRGLAPKSPRPSTSETTIRTAIPPRTRQFACLRLRQSFIL